MPKVRKVNISFDDMTKYWFGGNPWITYMNDAMHLIFPDGERFFIRSVQAYSDQIDDPQLKERVKAFIGQEVQHGKVHEEFWKVMREQGIDIDEFLNFYRSTAYDVIEKTATRLLGPEMALSVTAALEHYTAMMADMSFNDELTKLIPDSMALLFKWHAAEEIEHKSVAYDVFQKVDGRYSVRIGGFLIASVMLWLYVGIGQMMFIARDKDLNAMQLLASLPGQFEVTRRMIQGIGPSLLQYFKPGFHPDDIENYDIVENFFKEYEKTLLETAQTG